MSHIRAVCASVYLYVGHTGESCKKAAEPTETAHEGQRYRLVRAQGTMHYIGPYMRAYWCHTSDA